ncbi:MAG: RNA polymerase sigma factor [Microthrixaceae bacterium]
MRPRRRRTDLRRLDDPGLVELARNGDAAALDELLARHLDRLRAVCRRVCRDPHEAEDALQDALVAITRGLAGFRGGSSFTTWASRIATNRCLDELRRHRRRPEPVEPDGPRLVRPTAEGAGPDASAVRAEDRRLVIEALAQLPPEQRDVVVLRDVLDLDYAGIAEELGLPIGTVRSRLARGRARLATVLAADGNPGAVVDVDDGEATVGAERDD